MMKNRYVLFNKWKTDLLHAIYPNFCLICEVETPHEARAICPVCLGDLHLTYFQNYTEPTPLDQLFWGRALLTHTYAHLFFTEDNATRSILHALKYRNRSDLAQHMGSEMGKTLKEISKFSGIQALIPVPLHPKKEFIRGYNQAEEIAKGIADEMGIPINMDLLKRTVFTESQTKKGKLSRWENMQNRFSTNTAANTHLKHIALIDDVVTTGSTLETCIRILRNDYPDLEISILSLAIAR